MAVVKKSDSYPETVIRALDELNFTARQGARIFIKVDARENERSTDPEVLSTIVKVCFVRGAGEIIVGDRIKGHHGHPLVSAVTKANAKFQDLSQDKFRKVRSKGAPSMRRGFKLPLSVLNADSVILVPRVMTDEDFGFLGSLTSGYNLVSDYDRFRIDHLGKKVEKTVEIQTALNVVLTVADATKVVINGQPFTTNTIIAGKRVEVDEEIHGLLKNYGASLPEIVQDLPMIAYARSIKIDAGSTEIGLVKG